MPQPPNPPPYAQVEFVAPSFSINNMLGGNQALTIDPNTGYMDGIPQQIGSFVIAYAVKEFRNGAQIGESYREFVFNVTNLNPSQSYDISGQVWTENNIPLDEGNVQLLSRDLSNDSLYLYGEDIVSMDGYYEFMDIPAGAFYLKASVSENSIFSDSYLPTYFSSEVFWYNSLPISQCDTSQTNRDIFLLPMDDQFGEGTLEGFIYINGNQDNPSKNIDLILSNLENSPLVHTSTNENGYFKFDNLAYQPYFINADIINSGILNSAPPLIDLNEDLQVYLAQEVENLTILTLSDVSETAASTISVTPNPFTNKIIIRGLEHANKIDISIYTLDGKLVMNHYENLLDSKSKTLYLDSLDKGLYILHFATDNEIQNIKLLKQ